MVRCDRAAALADDRWMRDRRLLADGADVMHDVGRVLVERVIDARFEVGLRAVVIDA